MSSIKSKRAIASLILLSALVLLWSVPLIHSQSSSSTNTVTLNPIADSYTDSKALITDSRVNQNFGGQEKLEVYYWHTLAVITERRFTYLKFNLTDFPPQLIITSAKLTLFATNVSATLHVAAYYCSDNSWTETGITWNNEPGLTGSSTASVVVSSPNQNVRWDITKDVQTAVQNQGKFFTEVLTPDETGDLDATVYFNSREAVKNQPYLEITYEKIQPSLNLDPPSSREVGETVRFTGSVSPAWQGIAITLKLTDPSGKSIELQSSTDPQGKYYVDYTVNKTGYWKATATSKGSQFFEASTSTDQSFPVGVPWWQQLVDSLIALVLRYWWILILAVILIFIWYFLYR